MDSGQSGLKMQSADESEALISESLDRYEASLGMPGTVNAQIQKRATELLNLSPSDLEKMSGEDCSMAAYVLYQFSWHIQRALNREHSTIAWAENRVKKIISSSMSAQQGYSFEERKMNAIRNDPGAQAVEKIRINAVLKASRIEYMPSKIEATAKALGFIRMKRHD